nr:SJCHGC08113 protein [Schistosoma japonicum]
MVDVLKIVSRMRLDRGGMVQSNEQYEFIHHVLAAYPLNGETFINSNHSTCDLQQSG